MLPHNVKTTSSIKSCRGDEEYADGFCYPRCRPGFKKTTNNFCTAICPPGMTNSVVGCIKDNYYNTAGTPLECGPGLEQSGALCYKPCKPGYNNLAGTCWQACGPGWVTCGMGCTKTDTECGTETFDQVLSVLTLAANIASLGMAAPATGALAVGKGAVKVGTKVMQGTTKVGRSLVKFVSKIKEIPNTALVKKAVQIKKRYYNERTQKIVETISTTKDVYDASTGIPDLATDFYSVFADDFAAQTSPEINDEINNRFGPKTARYLKEYWGSIQLVQMAGADGFQLAQDVLGLVSIVDPTGVVGVVAAFAKPKCQDVIPFPTLSKLYK
jgi:hypothetical protein